MVKMGSFLFVSIFLVILILTQAVFFLIRNRFNPELTRLRRELSGISGSENIRENIDLAKKRELSSIPWLNEFLLRVQIPLFSKLELLTQQSGTRHGVSLFILLSVTMAVVGAFLSFSFTRNSMIALGVAVLAGPIPFLYLRSLKNKRLKKFEEQLPDALDMISRSLRAGHSLSGGLQMVVNEFTDPIQGDFARTLGEINFGVGHEDALRNLAKRVDLSDLKFFVLAVIIQRQSGGNLSEILEKISYLIRERHKLHGRMMALSGEARISAIILSVLPFVIVALVFFLNRSYAEILINDRVGQIMSGVALAMMITGIIVMRKMIQIKV